MLGMPKTPTQLAFDDPDITKPALSPSAGTV